MKKILFVGSEAMPFAATGGLGDVLGSLPAAIKARYGEDADVRVVMPLYDAVSENWRAEMKTEAVFTVSLSWRRQYCGVRSLVRDGVTYYFIDNEYYFRRGALYGQYDDGERFAFFSMAVVEMLEHISFYPDILHAHDWQAALSVVYLNQLFRWKEGYAGIRTVFTIHNIEYQGKYDPKILTDVFGLSSFDWRLMEYDGCINLMKAAIVCADKVTTVSPRYAGEIRSSEYGHGLEHILDAFGYKLIGILNGIDYKYYDPATDPAIAANYSADHLKGKEKDKLALQKEVGLPERTDIPMLAVVSRLVTHKGLDLIREMMYGMVQNHDLQLVVLGKGEVQYEDYFRWLEAQFPDKVRALITYDRDLSKRVYAASDIFLMPSRSEPCGLSQMIASRYGSIPVVRETGGLYDSIKGYWEENGEVRGNGFTFANYNATELYDRTDAALGVWWNPEKREKLLKKIMTTDFSWRVSAEKYMEMYGWIV